jgi:hypothetical protein
MAGTTKAAGLGTEGAYQKLPGSTSLLRIANETVKPVRFPAMVDVSVIVPHPTDPRVLTLGTRRGVYITQDGGETWNSSLAGRSITALARAPDAPHRLWAATTTGFTDDMHISQDGGVTWQPSPSPALGLAESFYASSIVASPLRAGLLIVTGSLTRQTPGTSS